MSRCQKCGREELGVPSRGTDGKGFNFCDECYEKILDDPQALCHSVLRAYEARQTERRERESKEIAEWKAEQERTARTCTRCGAKHHNNATLCTSCFREEFGL